jgi:hypothetical protein
VAYSDRVSNRSLPLNRQCGIADVLDRIRRGMSLSGAFKTAPTGAARLSLCLAYRFIFAI